ncbi:TPA: DUF4926 domain-containing protein [Neisseria lactamica]|uniref:DUF4926 domain-containing protein n=1 Tax=Neisseria lactamica TaxID=486 RepID=UPI000BB671A7|nr:DUF4926 domain-containing protein [Neisseria lactamica]
MNLNDVVKLKVKQPNSNVLEGSIGTIIEVLQELPSAVFEVEFINKNGELIDTLTLAECDIEPA